MDQKNIAILEKEFSGEIIRPDDAEYQQASKSYVSQGSPVIVLKPKTAADVSTAVRYAREHSLTISVRSGGHSIAGHCTNNGGIIIDCSAMSSVDVIDKAKNLVRIGAGATWKKVADTLQQHGLAISSGDSTSVGVGGLALGGGVGWMVRKYGLTIDSLKGAEIVTADGKILRLSADENSDLFWAIRGGGGNFGIVTYFEFTAQSVTQVFSGQIIYSTENLPSLLEQWREFMRTTPDELTIMFLLMPTFFGNPPAAIAWICYAGDDEAGMNRAINPLLKAGTVVQNSITKKNYADVLEEPHPPEGMKVFVNNGFVKELTDEMIASIAADHCKEGSPVLQLRTVGGAMNRINSTATAFAHRSSAILLISATFVPMGSSEEEIAKAMVPWKSLTPFVSGAYINFFSSATAEVVASAYPPATYERLKKIKKMYDPENIFNQNYNITPSGN